MTDKSAPEFSLYRDPARPKSELDLRNEGIEPGDVYTLTVDTVLHGLEAFDVVIKIEDQKGVLDGSTCCCMASPTDFNIGDQFMLFATGVSPFRFIKAHQVDDGMNTSRNLAWILDEQAFAFYLDYSVRRSMEVDTDLLEARL